MLAGGALIAAAVVAAAVVMNLRRRATPSGSPRAPARAPVPNRQPLTSAPAPERNDPPSASDPSPVLDAEAIMTEITALTTRAVESVERGREAEALRALARVEDLSKSPGLPPSAKSEIDRHLWWSYTRLGVARVEAKDFEEALDPLFRAIRVRSIDPAKYDETRWAMVKALEGVVATRAATIREVVASGHGDAAVVQAERLWTLLRSGIAAGAPRERLMRAMATSRALLEELGQHPT